MSDIFQYAPMAFRAMRHLDEIQALKAKAMPHIEALLALVPEARLLYAAIVPEAQRTTANDLGLAKFSVSWLQESLNSLGEKIKVDADYGESTRAAVKRFQLAHNLEPDGWAGFETILAIGAALKK